MRVLGGDVGWRYWMKTWDGIIGWKDVGQGHCVEMDGDGGQGECWMGLWMGT